MKHFVLLATVISISSYAADGDNHKGTGRWVVPPLECLASLKEAKEQKKPVPPLTIFEESFGAPECNDVKCEYFRSAALGECSLTLGGTYCDFKDSSKTQFFQELAKKSNAKVSEDTRVAFYDDPPSHALLVILGIYGNISHSEKASLSNKRSFLEQLVGDNKFLPDAWKAFRKQDSTEDDEKEIVKVIDTVIEAQTAKNADKEKIKDTKKFLSVMEKFARFFPKYLEDRGLDLPEELELPKQIDTFIKESDLTTRRKVLDTLSTEWRVKRIVPNIGKLYCEAFKSGKPFHVIVNKGEGALLSKLLEHASEESLPIEMKDSFEEANRLVEKEFPNKTARTKRKLPATPDPKENPTNPTNNNFPTTVRRPRPDQPIRLEVDPLINKVASIKWRKDGITYMVHLIDGPVNPDKSLAWVKGEVQIFDAKGQRLPDEELKKHEALFVEELKKKAKEDADFNNALEKAAVDLDKLKMP